MPLHASSGRRSRQPDDLEADDEAHSVVLCCCARRRLPRAWSRTGASYRLGQREHWVTHGDLVGDNGHRDQRGATIRHCYRERRRQRRRRQPWFYALERQGDVPRGDPTCSHRPAGHDARAPVLRQANPGIAGRVDDFIVPLRAGSLYRIGVSLDHYWSTATKEFGLKLARGRYRIEARFEGQGAQHENLDTPGIGLLNYWKGMLRSNSLAVEVLLRSARADKRLHPTAAGTDAVQPRVNRRR